MEVALRTIIVSRPAGHLARMSPRVKRGDTWTDDLIQPDASLGQDAKWKTARLRALRGNGSIVTEEEFHRLDERLLHTISLVGRPETATSGEKVDLGQVDPERTPKVVMDAAQKPKGRSRR